MAILCKNKAKVRQTKSPAIIYEQNGRFEKKMPLTIQDLRNKSIYKEKSGTLAERVDFAWSVYSSNDIQNPNKKNIKKEALMFLTYALNIQDPQDINGQFIELMEERNKYKTDNPGYIPGKSPSRIPFNPATVIPTATPLKKKNSSPEVAAAITQRELLDVNYDSKMLDLHANTIFLDERQRAELRVIISSGTFMKNGTNFDTSLMHSHNKPGFGAFTLNANGELSVFVHNRMRDRIAHSSMNSGVPVVAAGEIQIEDGVLKKITTHSGHYRPSLFNVYRLLEHFSQSGIDINQAQVVSFDDPSSKLTGVKSKVVYYDAYKRDMYETPANQIYMGMLQAIDKSANVINEQVNTYKKGGFLTTIFAFKDKITGSNLTAERNKIASAFEAEITEFKRGLKPELSEEELQTKKEELHEIVDKYEQENKALSVKNDKKESSGRFAATISHFKEQLQALRSSDHVEPQPEESASMKNIS